jgi:hypothetical protein
MFLLSGWLLTRGDPRPPTRQKIAEYQPLRLAKRSQTGIAFCALWRPFFNYENLDPDASLPCFARHFCRYVFRWHFQI